MDPNASLTERRTNKRHCCVSECNTNSRYSNSLHRFPLRDKNLYLKWLKALKIEKPSNEMYVCSKHFRENDFFGGWLAVEPNKRRLKRGVIPSLELPDSELKRVKVSESSLLDNSEEFAASLNLLPVKKNDDEQDSSINEPSCSKKNDPISNHISEPTEKLSSDPDNLLILKRIGEIKEAPEFQAKKKHDAQMYMKRMRYLKNMQFKNLPEAETESNPHFQSGSSKLKVKSLQELTQPELKKIKMIKKEEKSQNGQHSQVKKVRLLTHAEVESMRESPTSQFKKIRVVTQSQLKKFKLEPSLLNGVKKSQKNSKWSVSQSTDNNTSDEPATFDLNRIRRNVQELMMVKENQDLCNGNVAIKEEMVSDFHESNNFEDLMKTTARYFDKVAEELNKTSPFTSEDNLKINNFQGSAHDATKNSKKVPQNQGSVLAKVSNLEKLINEITKDVGGTQLLNSGASKKGFKNVALQTESDWESQMKSELEKAKKENTALKDEISSLKNKVALLEREVIGSRKGQLLYVYKSK